MKAPLISLICSVVVLVICWQANPNFYFIGDDLWQILARPPKAPATVFRDLKSSCQAVDQYRHTPNRDGVSQLGRPPANLSIQQQIRPLNAGIHGASKSSPAVDDSGILCWE